MRFHTVSKLGEHTSLTKEGYLLCEGVPIARTGRQRYHMSEVPLTPNSDGFVDVERDSTEVFNPTSISSFHGKPIVNDHPMVDVGPDNWQQLAIGLVSNPRRGHHAQDDLLLADLLFTTPAGIAAVRRGKRAISVGYDADYDQVSPGLGRQKGIIANHVALVDQGRCGSRCTILDTGQVLYNYEAALAEPFNDGAGVVADANGKLVLPDPEQYLGEQANGGGEDRSEWFFGDGEGGPQVTQDWWHTDIEWDPAQHPQAPAGAPGGTGGQFVEAGGGGGGGVAQHAPTLPQMTAKAWVSLGNKLKAKIEQAHEEGQGPQEIAATLKEWGGNYANQSLANYANAMLKAIEEHHGLAKGSLGKAMPKAPGAKKPKEIPEEVAELPPDVQQAMMAEHAASLAEEEQEPEHFTGGGEPSEAELEKQYGELFGEETKAHGTAPEDLEHLAQDPAKLQALSKSSHELGQKIAPANVASHEAHKEIKTWTDPAGYKKIQNWLRGVAGAQDMKATVDKLDAAMEWTQTTENVHAYRGVHGPLLDNLEKAGVGGTFTEKGFTGTTLDPKVATHYAKGGQGGSLMHIHLPKGQNAVYASHPDLNDHTSEHELLLPHGLTFKVLKKETVNLPQYDYSGNKTGPGGPTTMYHVEIVGQEKAAPAAQATPEPAKPAEPKELTPVQKMNAKVKELAAHPDLQPHAGSTGQQEIHQVGSFTHAEVEGYETSAPPTGAKIEEIKKIMADPAKAGAYTQAYGQKWIAALEAAEKGVASGGGQPAATAPTPQAAAPTPTPAAPKKKTPHYKSESTHYFEDAQGNEIKSVHRADTKKIPGNFYQDATAAYGGNPNDGDTYDVGKVMNEYRYHVESTMTQQQKSAYTGYKDGDYDDMNDYLRGKDATASTQTKGQINQLRKALNEHVLPADTPLFRGLRAGLEAVTGFSVTDPEQAVGRAFVHKNFASCSRNLNTARSFGGFNYSGPTTMIHVTMPAGANALVMGDQNKGGYELETVLPDHCVFRIDRVEAHPESGPGKHTVHCTYLGTTGKTK